MFAPSADFTRMLQLSGIKVDTTSGAEVEVVPLLCRGGGLSVTSAPETFCRELLDPEGQMIGAGDSIVLEVSGEQAAVAVVDRVRLGYRDGWQWGTHEAGSKAVVRVVAP